MSTRVHHRDAGVGNAVRSTSVAVGTAKHAVVRGELIRRHSRHKVGRRLRLRCLAVCVLRVLERNRQCGRLRSPRALPLVLGARG